MAEEHPELMEAAARLFELLKARGQGFTSSDGASVWLHHMDYGYRAEEVASHLEGALDLAERARYASAYVLIRTGFEQCMLDRLLLLGTKHRDRLTNVDEAMYAQLEAELVAATEPWTHGVVGLERTKNGALIIRGPHRVVDQDNGEVVELLSHYYVVLDRHDAALGPPSIQAHFDDGLSRPAEREEWATRNRSLYTSFLRWSAVLDNLVLNDLATERETVQLDVHYRFLSAFTHATPTGYKHLERTRGHPGFGRDRDHLLGELVLLYAIAIAATELNAFLGFTAVRPKLDLEGRQAIEEAVEEALDLISYFWFPGGKAHSFDRYIAANHKAWRAWDDIKADLRTATPPERLSEDEIGYYPDPLERLREMHNAVQEMTTGFSYAPPW